MLRSQQFQVSLEPQLRRASLHFDRFELIDQRFCRLCFVRTGVRWCLGLSLGLLAELQAEQRLG